MVAEIGHYALMLALVLAIVQGTLPLIGAQTGIESWVAVARPAALGQLFFIAVSFGALTWAFVVSDFTVAAVVANSHSAKPMIYKISGVWGNHEGSLLLWILILAMFGGAVAAFGRNLPPYLRARVLSVQGLIGVGFLLFILLTSTPFERLANPPLDGNGLNPLLQDPGLAIHPPFLYLGYVGFSMAFSFAIAALIEGRVDPAWARWVRPWTLLAWCFLTIGIALGSWWAYYELGWGGWWFWDPVENASFMPWLLGTALLHSAIVVEKRDTLKAWTILLAILTFSLSLLGTFIVRSGVLTSVHAFATDPERGVFILLFLAIVVGGSLLLFALRGPALRSGGLFSPISREGALVLNNMLLTTACATVLLGTLYPLFLDALTGEKVSVGPPYFNATFVPLMVPLFVALAAGPMMAWKRGDLGAAMARLKFAFALSVIVALGTWYMRTGGPVLAVFGMALGVWLVAGALLEWFARLKLFTIAPIDSWRRLRGLPRAAHGMTLAHIGVGIVIMGVTGVQSWTEEQAKVMRPGETISIGQYDLTLKGAKTVQGPNYSALRGTFDVSSEGKFITTMEPETRSFTTSTMTTTEAAIRPTLTSDLYAVIGDSDGKGGYATRFYVKPLVHWIWAGCLIMVIGGFVSLSDRRHRVGAPAAKRKSAPLKEANA
jgi:cytochrome c-type biogenesis protein CcmF